MGAAAAILLQLVMYFTPSTFVSFARFVVIRVAAVNHTVEPTAQNSQVAASMVIN